MTHPRPAPRAPIVWHDDRTPLSEAAVLSIGPEIASTKRRAEIGAETFLSPSLAPPHLPGQLWQRLAELEVATYGESARCPACNGWGVVSVMQHDGNEDTYSCLDCGGSGEVITFGDVKRRGPLVTRMEEAQARRIIAAEIEGRRPAMRAAAMRRLAPDGLPLYFMTTDGSGRVELARGVMDAARARAAEAMQIPTRQTIAHDPECYCARHGSPCCRRGSLS